MNTLVQDIKHAFRMFRISPGFAATAIVVLTLGIGVNAAVFTVVNTVLLKPVPFPEPDRLVFAIFNRAGEPVSKRSSPIHFMHWRRQTDVLEDVAAWRSLSLDYTASDTPESVTAGIVSEAYFRVLRAPFAEGRGFSAEEDTPNAAKTIVVSYDFWVRRLGGDPGIVGKTVSLNGNAYTVIGITGREFDVRDFDAPKLWIPLQLDANTTEDRLSLEIFARLRPGVTLESAQARVAASKARFLERFPDVDGEYRDVSFGALPVQEVIVREARRTLLVLAGAVGLVLLIACANVAGLLLVRATGREHEIAIRYALGAGRSRIVRQLLTESVVLSLIGGALGLLTGSFGIRALLSIDSAGLPRLGQASGLVGLDWRIVCFTVGLALLTSILFGLVPALVGTRGNFNAVIKDSSGRSGSGLRQNRMRSLLVVAEVSLAVVLVIGAGLLIRTSIALGAVDPGLSVENVLTMRTWFSEPRFSSTASVVQTSDAVLDRIRSIPGVESAASAWGLPFQENIFLPFKDVGRDDNGRSNTGFGVIVPASSDYFRTLGISPVVGRLFDANDNGRAAPVVIINQAMADQYWPNGGDPLAERIRIGGGVTMVPEAADEPARRIVGIVRNVRHAGIAKDSGPTMYLPLAQASDGLNALFARLVRMAWIVRTRAEPGAVSGAVRRAIRQETVQPLTDVQLMKDALSLSTSRQRLNTWLMIIFGGLALLLAAVGIYGIVAYSVRQRRQEIGIRMALGARLESLRNTIILEGMRLALVGVAVGLVAAFFLANVLASILFGVEPHDVAVFVTVPVVLTAVAFLAVSVPALRGSRVDPTEALRHS